MPHVGVGYHHDLEKRLSYGIQLRYDLSSDPWVAHYQRAFHFNDNDRGSFYLRPVVGVRCISLVDATQVPVGLRMGAGGGLENFHTDLHVAGIYDLGTRIAFGDMYNTQQLVATAIHVGSELGWGWDSKASRR